MGTTRHEPGTAQAGGPRIALLLPAAGAAQRMGTRDKLLEPVAGAPLIRRQARAALEAGLGGPVIVTLPPADSKRHAGRRAALAGLAVDLLEVAAAAEGMSASLRAAAGRVAGCDGLMILPPDMPRLGLPELARIAAAFAAAPSPRPILRGAAADGTPGHPVLLPDWCLPELVALAGDTGARAILARHAGAVRLVPLAGDAATLDLDTPEDWAAFRAEDRRRDREGTSRG
jgi:molybdenum cofactor cytidylyltransferase